MITKEEEVHLTKELNKIKESAKVQIKNIEKEINDEEQLEKRYS